MAAATQTSSPRKIEPWGIGIAIFLIGFVLLLVGFVIFASNQSRDLVESSYYERGLEYDGRIEELQRAGASAVRFSIDNATRQLTMTLTADSTQRAGLAGELHLYRPSNAEWDKTFELHPDVNGAQLFDTSDLPKGAWTAKVSWTVDGQDYYYEESLYFP